MAIALAVIVPTLLLAYLGAWRTAEPWYDRRAMHPAARGMLWISLAFSAIGFGVVLLWAEILALHLGKIPGWGAKAYAPAIETVAILDALSLAATGIVHAIVLNRRGDWHLRLPHGKGSDLAENAIDLAQDLAQGRGSGGRAALADLGSADAGSGVLGSGSGGGASWEWPSLGLDLDLGEDGAILAVGIGVFLLAAFLVALSLTGGGFATYAVLRAHARP